MTAMCERFDAEAEDVALGHASPQSREELLAHASTCARCGRLLRELSATVDRLLELAPAAEPPVGFETRAVSAMSVGTRSSNTARPRQRRVRVIALAAAFAILGLIAGVGITRATGGAHRTRSSEFGARIVTNSGASLGVAEVYGKPSPRVVVLLDAPHKWSGVWSCELQRADDGSWVKVGSWTSADAPSGVWSSPIPAQLSTARAMRIRGSDGSVIATTRFA
jgi:hypothetical protein